MRLHSEDIQRLIHEPSAQVRSGIAQKVCEGYCGGEFGDRESHLAEEIIRLLLRDTSMRVRQTLSAELKHSTDLPHDVAQRLADDHEQVAEEILRHSTVLTEEDLIEIVEATSSLRKLMAIASRENISAPLSDALVKTGEHSVTRRVITNAGAQIDDDTFLYLLEEYYADDSILQALVERAGLPYHIAEKLFTLVSKQFQKDLTRRYRLSKRVSDDVTANAREITTMQFLSPWMSQQDINQLVDEMHKNKRLTDSVIIRSLCIGDLRFFQTSIAKRASVGLQNTKLLMMDPGGKGFRACYEAADMPEEFGEAVRILFQFAQEETEFGQYHHHRFTQQLIERITESGCDQTIENMPYLLTILGRSMQDGTPYH